MHDLATIRAAQIVLPCATLDPTVEFFVERLGFRLDAIFPADDPSVAVLSGHGVTVRLDGSVDGGGGRLRLLCDDDADVTRRRRAERHRHRDRPRRSADRGSTRRRGVGGQPFARWRAHGSSDGPGCGTAI